LDGRIYEAPVALIGKRVELLYHQSDVESIEVKYKSKWCGLLRAVDLAVNCRVKRDRNSNVQIHETNDRGADVKDMKRNRATVVVRFCCTIDRPPRCLGPSGDGGRDSYLYSSELMSKLTTYI